MMRSEMTMAIRHFQRRVVEALQADHPQAAKIVANLPVWCPSESELVAQMVEDAKKAVEPIVAKERQGEAITADVMEFRMRSTHTQGDA